jgi:hypothetical protein
MESWEIDFYWLKVRHFIKDAFRTSTLPDLETILFLIGVQELGHMQSEFSKEEKMELMHIGTARLLSTEGYFQLSGRDEKDWPQWVAVKTMDFDEKEREEKLMRLIIDYFDDVIDEEE